MTYCSHCGEKIPEDAYFCPKCGNKTVKGLQENAPSPSDELKDAFYKVGLELERAFNIAARETHAAYVKARENMQKTSQPEPVICSNCGTKNPSKSIFCSNCGKKIELKKE